MTTSVWPISASNLLSLINSGCRAFARIMDLFGKGEADVQTRRVGRSGLEVSALGLGCMGMSEFYGPSGEAEGIDTIHRAIELRVTFLDTADIYGMGRNEELVGRAIRDRRDQVVLATKFGVLRTPDGSFVGVKGSPIMFALAAKQVSGVSVLRLLIFTISTASTPIRQ